MLRERLSWIGDGDGDGVKTLPIMNDVYLKLAAS